MKVEQRLESGLGREKKNNPYKRVFGNISGSVR